MTLFPSKASVRRSFTMLADADRLPLVEALVAAATGGPLPADDVVATLSEYLLDPNGRAILATTEERTAWLAGSLFQWVGPGNAVPLDDQIAALVVAGAFVDGEALSPALVSRRFAPRADDLVALAVLHLDLPSQARALEALFAQPGPDEDTLGLSTVQCGRVLAWAPHLLEWPVAERIVDALIARLSATTPRPHLEGVARALGPLAASESPLAEKIRTAAFANLERVQPPKPASFLAQVQTIGKTRSLPDQDTWMAMPHKEAAAASAYVLGFGASLEREAFYALRTRVLDRPGADELMLPFIEGLVAAAHTPAVAELVGTLLEGTDAEIATALGLAATLPLDDVAGSLASQLDAASASQRALACAAVELLEGSEDLDLDKLLALRLGDPSPEVAAAATRVLMARGRRDLVARHSAKDPHPVRRAVVLAALGELEVPVIGELVRGTLDDLDAIDVARTEPDADEDVSPITHLLAESLLHSVKGLETAVDLIGGVRDAVGLLALAALPGAQRDVGVLAPPHVRAKLAGVTLEIAMNDGGDHELGALALYLLARMSAGDAAIAELVANALAATEGFAAQLLAALGENRVADARTAAALAPLLGPESPLGARIAASAIAGRALPPDHAAWDHVRELLELGPTARAAAWVALRDRVRRAPADQGR